MDCDVGEETRADNFHKWILNPFIGALLSELEETLKTWVKWNQ